MSIQEKVTIITSSVEAGTLETLPVIPEMELIPHEELFRSGRVFEPEEKICITSEYSLSTVVNCLDPSRKKAVKVLKDKFLFRNILKEIYPEYFFRSIKPEEISTLKVDRKSVLKPSRGIFGTAVRIVDPDTDFHTLGRELNDELRKNARVYPDSVLSPADFILEDFIDGEEYAVDMFYDSVGNPNIVNIYHHPIPQNKAYLHMLYNSSKASFEAVYDKSMRFFSELNRLLDVTNFAMHAEFKVWQGRLFPVEINCMRFGGMGLCNLLYYSLGINPFLCFLQDQAPDWKSIWKEKGDKIYSFFIAYNGAGIEVTKARPLPEKLKNQFTQVLHEHLFDYRRQLAFGIYFLEESEENIRKLLNLEFDQFFEAS